MFLVSDIPIQLGLRGLTKVSEFVLEGVCQQGFNFQVNAFLFLTCLLNELIPGKGEGIVIAPHVASHLLGGTVWKITKDGEDVIYAVDFNHRKERCYIKHSKRKWECVVACGYCWLNTGAAFDTRTGKLWSALGTPSDFHDGDSALLQPFDFPIHDLNWFLHEVEFFVDLDLFQRNDEGFVG
ncbi:hypothetical protein LXL04_023353 [Taraxacum kok-saghyz]